MKKELLSAKNQTKKINLQITRFLKLNNKILIKGTAGFLELENANLSVVAFTKPETLVQTDVKWFLSTNRNDLPKKIIENGKSIFRSIKIASKESND
jgi:hypothetical protein